MCKDVSWLCPVMHVLNCWTVGSDSIFSDRAAPHRTHPHEVARIWNAETNFHCISFVHVCKSSHIQLLQDILNFFLCYFCLWWWSSDQSSQSNYSKCDRKVRRITTNHVTKLKLISHQYLLKMSAIKPVAGNIVILSPEIFICTQPWITRAVLRLVTAVAVRAESTRRHYETAYLVSRLH